MAGKGRNKGSPKVGGRKSGTPNKKTIKAVELAEKLGIDPFEVLLLYAKRDHEKLGLEQYEKRYNKEGEQYDVLTIDPSVSMRAAAEATKYIYPQRKSVEFKDEDGQNPFKSMADFAKTMSDDQLDSRIKVLWAKLYDKNKK